VHGGEESGTDASLRVLWELADRTDCAATRILDKALVVILPIQNPDGREADTRRNAYGFDMNRERARAAPDAPVRGARLQAVRPRRAVGTAGGRHVRRRHGPAPEALGAGDAQRGHLHAVPELL
jgi:hypothetical protein